MFVVGLLFGDNYLHFQFLTSVSRAGNYCIVTFAERRSGPDARVPYNADTTRLIPC